MEKHIKHHQQKQRLSILNCYNGTEELLEKSKKAQYGEIRMWNGKKMQKQPDGTWKELSTQKNFKLIKEELLDEDTGEIVNIERMVRMVSLQPKTVKIFNATNPELVKLRELSIDKKQELTEAKNNLKQLKSEKKQILIDMEQEAETEGGSKADEYGTRLEDIQETINEKLNDIDNLTDELESITERLEQLEDSLDSQE